MYKRHEISKDFMQKGEIPEDAVIEAHLRVTMHEYMKEGSVPWSFCFRRTKLKEEPVWSSGTPESVSGETSLLTQVVLDPRVSHSADLPGHMQDEGRRTVSCSRSRRLMPFHYAVSGETSLLTQVVLDPRVSHSADLRGHMQDEGRRIVSSSRSQLSTSWAL